MTTRMNPELAAIINAESTRYNQVRALNTALGTTKRVKIKRHATASTPQADIWATGTLVRDAALGGAFTFTDAKIVTLGVTSDMVTYLAADLGTGASVLRIEGNSHWLEFTIGLAGTDITLPSNLTTSNSFAFTSVQLFGSSNLPDGTPDSVPPTVGLTSSNTNVTTTAAFTLTATPVDAEGDIDKVEFFRDGLLFMTRQDAPWETTDSLTYVENGTVIYTARAYDMAGNSTLSSPVNVTCNIAIPVDTGTAVAVGSELTTIAFTNTSGGTLTNVPVTIGQVLKVGALPASGAAIELRAADNSIVAAQIDIGNLHLDGTSVRHCGISTIIPSIAAGQTLTYSVRRKTAAAATALVPADFPGLNATVTLVDTGTDVGGPNAGTTYTATCATQLSNGQYITRMSGPICSEWIVRAPLMNGGTEHPDLCVFFHIRAYTGQKAKIDFVIENCWAKPKNPQPTTAGSIVWDSVSLNTRIYRVLFKIGTTTVYERAVAGYCRTRLMRTSGGFFDSTPTGAMNDSTAYTCSVDVNGTVKNISIMGSQMQTYKQMVDQFNIQLGGSATMILDENLAVKITSNSSGTDTYVKITDYGSLFTFFQYEGATRPIYGGEVIHDARTRWKRTHWWNIAEPAINPVFNVAYLKSTKAIPNYDSTLSGDITTIDKNYTTVTGNEDIGRNGMATAVMGATGYSPGIGLMPEWASLWLISQNPKAYYVLKKMGDLSGSWPMFIREYDTGEPIDTIKWPYAALAGTSADNKNPTTQLSEGLLPTSLSPNLVASRNLPDTAHQPDFNTLPYMVTFDHYYLEGLLMQSQYSIMNYSAHAVYRDGSKCLMKNGQVRAKAWTLRSMSHSRYLLPTGHSLIPAIQKQLDENAKYWADNFAKPSGPWYNLLGIDSTDGAVVYDYSPSVDNGIAPWQDDFFTASVGRSIELGNKAFMKFFLFKCKYPIGRLTSGADFCWQTASNYSFRVRDTTTSAIYSNFNQMYLGSMPAAIISQTCGTQGMADALPLISSTTPTTINAMVGYPLDIFGNPSIMEPAIAYAVDHGAPGAADAWLVLTNRSVKPNYNKGAQFAIAPRA